ncbi:DUF305 domain-containing protein [Acidisphaera sp. L21]|jgi:uncharacterized protein (DUF305 family)|uniref:CopM family metallochaperone n=1 Tax=Acidisphaera sp. L21 TaxID=1641851 RepID=UPI00131E8F84|nr:DUF305 domain-containing protein [Acidisphaera sp. L21]
MIRQTLAILLLIGGTASAQMAPMNHAVPTPGGENASTAGYKQAMQGMMKGMDVPYTGDADHDFVMGMLPHHQGAVDMARVELQYGHDLALRKLARDIIASQTKEQAFMRRWLERHKTP